MKVELLEQILQQFEQELSEPLLNNNNFPPELPAWLDPSTDEYVRDDDNH